MRERFGRWRFERGLKSCRAADIDLLRSYADAEWQSRDTPIHEARLIALDFELDGLGPRAHVLQAGWLPFTTCGIEIGGACSIDVRSMRRLDADAVTVHGIGEERAQSGEALQDVASRFLRDLAGRVVVAHGASIEIEVIRRISKALFGIAVPVRSICTLALERRLSPNRIGNDGYRLAAARKRYNLPDYQQHDALSDALAAAELFLAQLTRMAPVPRLGSLETW